MIYNSAKERAFDYNDSFNNKDSVFRMGKVVAIMWGENLRSPVIVFYGEKKESYKNYKCLNSYVPQVNDHVLLARINGTYVILGKVNGL